MADVAVRPLEGSRPVASDDQVVLGEGWRITILSDGLVRIERSADGAFEDRASTLAMRRDLPVVPFDVERRGDGAVTVRTSRVAVQYDGKPFSATGLRAETVGGHGRPWRYGDEAEGLGGTARTLDEVDGRAPLGPGVVARGGIAVLDDSDSFLFADDGWVAGRRPGGRDLYLFAFGDDHPAAVRAFYDLSGHPPLLPRWALGNWWSRFHPYTAEDYLSLMDRFRSERLPFSVAVLDMDWHRVDVPAHLGSGWTGYSWNRELIPDPPALLGALRQRGLRTTLNLHPADGVRPHEDAHAAMAARLGLDPATTGTIPFDPTDREFLAAYFEELHHPLEQEGVDFWWIDWQQGEDSAVPGMDPLWLLNHFHHLDAARDGGSGMTFSRYAGPGSHRYAVGFSGDTVISWDSLAFQPEFTATASNIGYGWWSHDIGGHLDGIHDDELTTRWVQLGVFSPILRMHSTRNPFIRKEPWALPSPYRETVGEALRLRHRLVPYLHTMNHRAAEGVPLVRPMYHGHPRADEAYRVPNEFWFGSELLVAPVVTPADAVTRSARTEAWLPPGGWTDVFTGTRYEGDRMIALHRDIASIPVLLRDGGILPLSGVQDLDVTRNPEALEVLVAPAASGRFTLVEDPEDGRDTGRCTTLIEWDAVKREVRIGEAVGASRIVPEIRSWTVTFLEGPPAGLPVAEADGSASEVAPVVSEGRWSITVTGNAATPWVIRAPATSSEPSHPLPAVRRILARASTSNVHKLDAWRLLEQRLPRAATIGRLTEMGLAPALLDALVEELQATPAREPVDLTHRSTP